MAFASLSIVVNVSFGFRFIQISFSESAILTKPKEFRIPLPKGWQAPLKYEFLIIANAVLLLPGVTTAISADNYVTE